MISHHPLFWIVLFLIPNQVEGNKTQKMSSIAPSLPALTSEQEDHLDEIIDRFIQYDTGKLRGVEGQKALKEFEKLGTEAIPALIRGLNRAANIDHSCPVLVISKKLHKMLMSSDDPQLLDFAHDEIGAGVNKGTHGRVLADIRVQCLLRKNMLLRETSRNPRSFSTVTTPNLIKASESEKGQKLRIVLEELKGRKGGPEIMVALAKATTNSDESVSRLAVGFLDQRMSKQTISQIRESLSEDSIEIRKSAIRVAVKIPELVPDVIRLLSSTETEIQEYAHTALKNLKGGMDLGNDPDKWMDWWRKR